MVCSFVPPGADVNVQPAHVGAVFECYLGLRTRSSNLPFLDLVPQMRLLREVPYLDEPAAVSSRLICLRSSKQAAQCPM
jgi:hypothetical protein